WRLDAAMRPAMDDAGFSLVEPPRSDKIPVLFVHGLQHSPTDFAKLIAGLMSNPTLRTRYQFITYRWATGLPLPISVAIFRRQLGEFWSWFDEQAPGARERGYWVLSHSMGGLLAKTLMVESGDRIIDAMFRVPRAEIDLESELGRKVERALVYHPDPELAGVVFMAVPHRGSGYAASAIGDIGTELIKPGAASTTLVRDFVERYGEQLKPEVLVLLRKKTTSLQNLRPNDWYLRALGSCPFSPNIPYHSIIGDMFGTAEMPVGDGAVSYKSAHLDGAASETVVRAPHNLQKTKIGLAPVKRILLESLQEK
ncbi:MAG: lipase family protein, partial [Planctomycetota bacterium]